MFEAIHAGLECGILSGKIADLDCVSFGPNNFDIHTPKERLSISSTEKVWKLIVEFLKRSIQEKGLHREFRRGFLRELRKGLL